ncbi:MAG TPA: peptidoglycan-binding protein [Mycobacteriales bacterium]|nr:peptidoglycan-binding protein [Mycobacteriales bacterium]
MTIRWRRWLTAGATLTLAGTTVAALLSSPAGADPASTAGGTGTRWTADLTRAGVDEVNLRHGTGLTVADPGFGPALAGAPGRGYAVDLLAPHSLAAPTSSVRAELAANVPAGGSVQVEVRGQQATGGWTEWREAVGTAPAQLPAPATAVQVRLTLQAAPNGASPTVTALALTAQPAAATTLAVPPVITAAVTAHVFATREGLVGGTTANGHVIRSRDHFVALPSRRGLAPNGSTSFSVRVCNPGNGRCETAPVWDVGPWNTTDDYWNPSSQRQRWQDLPQGRPEAQAAFQSGYNGGKDEFGRTVANPAGIDLADGTFWDGLGMTNNGFVDVTYLWTTGGGGGGGGSWPTVRQGATGERVKSIQYLLNQRGSSLAVDGDFGPATNSAVRSFQTSHSLAVDGVVGPNTWAALIVTVQQGSTGSAVRAVQSQLSAHGIATSVDGNFGSGTNTSVRSFQSSRGLTVDGIVGPNTWQALVS